MSTPERPTGGSHRRADSSSRLAVLIASLIGIAIIAIVVTVTLNKRGEPARKNAPQQTNSTLRKSSPSPTRPATSASASSGSPTAPASTTPPSSTSSSASSSSASTAGPTATTAPRPALDVLNDSRVTGLAARAAATFRSAGWDVTSTGNFHGTDVPETTIFYPDGDKTAADQLAAQFGIRRLAPASSGLSQTHLTVALARDWAQRG